MKFNSTFKISIFFIGIFIFLFSGGLKAQVSEHRDSNIVSLSKELVRQASVNPDSTRRIALAILSGVYSGDDSVKAYANEGLGDAYYYLQILDSAEMAYSRSLNAYSVIGDIEGQATQYNNLGLLSYFKGNFGRALENYNASLKLVEEINDEMGMARAHHNLGMVYGRWERYDQLFEHYATALSLYEKNKNQEGIAALSNNMGVTYAKMKQYDEALKYYRKSYFAYKELGDEKNMASISSNLGCLFVYLKENHRAMTYFQEAIDYFNKTGNGMGLVSTYSSLGDAYKEVGEIKKAISYYLRAEEENKNLEMLDQKKNNYYSLYVAYKEMGDYAKALQVYESYNEVKDSIFSADKYSRLVELEKKYHNEKMRREIVEVKSKEQRHEAMLWGLSVLFLFCAILVLIAIYVMKIKERQRRLVMEQKVLRTQMNPHFIFNSLSALQCYIMEERQDEAIDYIADFSSLMRLVLQYAKEEFITLKKEKEILEKYVRLQNRRFNNTINFDLDIDEDLAIEKVMVPPMLAQPFVENSFEHGRLEEKDNGFIKVGFSRHNNRLAISVEDNGVGIKASQKARRMFNHRSMAMDITRERIRLVQESNGQKHEDFEVSELSDSQMSGTRIVFWVPYQELS